MHDYSALWKWRPVSELSALAGAASVFLSIREAKVFLDSPMWCSSISELRLRGVGIPCDRIFSLFIEDEDLIFGCKKKLLQALQEAGVNESDKLLCVAMNCGPALVGDDITGICSAAANGVPVAVTDAGGFTGEFDDGYAKAVLALLNVLAPQPVEKIKNAVNILGYSPVDRYAEGTLQEIKRLLAFCGLEINVTVGDLRNSMESAVRIGRAEYNIVLNEERGLEPAKWLKDKLGQPYILTGLPFGIQGCREWIGRIASVMGVPVSGQFARELEVLREEIFQCRLQTFQNEFQIKRAVLSGTYEKIIPFAKAINREWKKAEIFVNVTDREEKNEFPHWDAQTKLSGLSQNELQILVGTEIDRVLLGDTDKTVFISIDDTQGSIRTAKETLAGIRGWAIFMERVFAQYRYLCFKQ